MKALLAVLVVALAPAHIRFAVLGVPVSVSAGWLILAAEVLAAAVTGYVFLASGRVAPAPYNLPGAKSPPRGPGTCRGLALPSGHDTRNPGPWRARAEAS